MSDILELGKAVNEKCQSKDGSVDHRYWAFRSVELLPALIAETERLRFQAAQIEALKEKLVEERAAVLTCDICYDINKNLAIDGTPTRVDDFTDEEERIKLARQQLKAEMPGVEWE